MVHRSLAPIARICRRHPEGPQQLARLPQRGLLGLDVAGAPVPAHYLQCSNLAGSRKRVDGVLPSLAIAALVGRAAERRQQEQKARQRYHDLGSSPPCAHKSTISSTTIRTELGIILEDIGYMGTANLKSAMRSASLFSVQSTQQSTKHNIDNVA